MAETVTFTPGGYRYLPFRFQYSSGVAAEPGFAIERMTLRRPLPLAQGFAAVEAYLARAGRPATAFCACELRSPAQFTEAGFIAFNEHYCQTLARWGIYDPDTRINPVARSNVCPEIEPPSEPMLYAFSYTAPVSGNESGTFVIAGSGEAPGGKGDYGAHIVRRGETSADAIADKARAVLGEMERRMGLLGFAWEATTAAHVYTVHDIHEFLGPEIVRRGAARNGTTWFYARPPVIELEFEMDTRSVLLERVF
ncbi:MAG: hypothetical protein R3D44_13730 [Hyphomicrobiaceae bacterium]